MTTAQEHALQIAQAMLQLLIMMGEATNAGSGRSHVSARPKQALRGATVSVAAMPNSRNNDPTFSVALGFSGKLAAETTVGIEDLPMALSRFFSFARGEELPRRLADGVTLAR